MVTFTSQRDYSLFHNGCKSDVITEIPLRKAITVSHAKDVVHVVFSRNKS